MYVCARCCLATVIAAVALLVPQFQANPIDASAPSSSPLPKAAETKETAAKTSEADVLDDDSIKEKLGQDTDQNKKTPNNEDPVIPRISVAANTKSAPATQHSVLTQGSVSQETTIQNGAAAGTNVVSEPLQPSKTDTSVIKTKNENSEAKPGIPRISVAANDKITEGQDPVDQKPPVETAAGNADSAPPHEPSQASITVSKPTVKKAEDGNSDGTSGISRISAAANAKVKVPEQELSVLSQANPSVPQDGPPYPHQVSQASRTSAVSETSVKNTENIMPPNEDPVIPRISVAGNTKSAPATQHSVLTQGSVSQGTTTQDGAAGTNVGSEPPTPSDTDTSAIKNKNENSEAKSGILRISVAANDKVTGEEQDPVDQKPPVDSTPQHEPSQDIATSEVSGAVIKTDHLATKVADNKAGTTQPSQDDQVSHKDKLPKINAVVEEMIKPAALSSPVSPQVKPVSGSEHSQMSEGTKVEERPASSDLPEEPGHQPKSTLDQTKSKNGKQVEEHVGTDVAKEELLQPPPASSDQPRKGEEGLIARSSGSAPSSDHPLTTSITPVHTIAQGSIATQAASLSPVSETHTNTNPNAYTITPNEFAQKTAVVHAQQTEETNKKATETASGDISNKHEPDIESGKGQAVTYPDNGLEETLKNNNGKTSDSSKSNTKAGSTNGINSDAEKGEQLQEVSHDIVEDIKVQLSSAAVSDSDLKALSSLVDEITNEIEAYSTEAAEFWNERKKKISWLSEASDVLQNYNDKITETEKYSKKCTTDERKKYHERKNLLESLINTCDRSLKREAWNDLQATIKSKLGEIRTVNADANAKISQISKEEEHFNERKLVIEDIAKRKLRDIFTESDKTSLSGLKDKALTQDEEDYKQCIESKETEDKGRTAIISETMSDIMKIKDCSDAMFT